MVLLLMMLPAMMLQFMSLLMFQVLVRPLMLGCKSNLKQRSEQSDSMDAHGSR
jgi:hypothetical protein